MQTLGLSDSTPRTEGRLKALLWPTIRNDGDFDYVTRQGFWVCQVVAAATLTLGAATGHFWLTAPGAAFFFLAGVGVREQSKIAAAGAFIVYLFETALTGIGVVRIVFLALLFANVRGSWLAARWEPDAAATSDSFRLHETLIDRFADHWPPLIWPLGRWVFYLLLALTIAGMASIALRWAHPFVTLGSRIT